MTFAKPSSVRSLLAVVLSLSLAFMAPVPAFAKLSSAEVGHNAVEQAESTESDAPGNRVTSLSEKPSTVQTGRSGTWLYRQLEDGLYLTGCITSVGVDEIEVPDTVAIAGELHDVVGLAPSPVGSAGPWSRFRKIVINSSNLATIDDETFKSCNALEEIDMSDAPALQRIGACAFADSGITSFVMPPALQQMGANAFYGCTDLLDITFNSVFPAFKPTDDGKYANPVAGAPHARIHVPWQSESYRAIGDYVLLSKGGSVLYSCPDDAVPENGAFSIPEGVRVIAASAFAGNKALRGVAIGSDVTDVNRYAFYGSSLESVVVPRSVSYLGSESFASCERLASIAFEEGFSDLAAQGARRQFADAGTLVAVTFPTTLTALSSGCFSGAKALREVDLGKTHVKAIPSAAFEGCISLKRIAFPQTLEELSARCFKGLGLITADLSATNVTSIPSNAFADCTNLVLVSLPAGLSEIGVGSFKGTSLLSIAVPANVTRLSKRAFADCMSLATVSGCAGVTRIEADAFANDRHLLAFPFGSALDFVSKAAFPFDVSAALPSHLVEQADGYYREDAEIVLPGNEYRRSAIAAFDAINAEREGRSLDALVLDADLMEAAMTRAAELSVSYPSDSDADHTRPLGIPYRTVEGDVATELIATGTAGDALESAQVVVDSWVAGDEEAEIVSAAHRCAGIGCFLQNGTLYWVALFGDEEDEANAVDIEDGSFKDGIAVKRTVSIRYDSSRQWLKATTVGDASAPMPGDSVVLRIGIDNGQGGECLPEPVSTFSFSTSDSSIASVAADGTVTFRKPGKVVVSGWLKGAAGKGDAYRVSCSFEVDRQANLEYAFVRSLYNKYYVGKAIEQDFDVYAKGGDVPLTKGVDYTVSYADNTDVGTATITIAAVEGNGRYHGSFTRSFEIKQATNTLATKAAKTYKAKKLKRKALTFELPQPRFGTASFKVAKKNKKGVITLKGGKIRVKKRTPAGTYSMKVTATVPETPNYTSIAKTITVKVTVK